MSIFKNLVAEEQARNIGAVADAIYENNKTQKEISEKEIASKNRVDIELSEYESMKEKIKELEHENLYLKEYFANIVKGLEDKDANVLWSLLMKGTRYKTNKMFNIENSEDHKPFCIGFYTFFRVSELELYEIENQVGKWAR